MINPERAPGPVRLEKADTLEQQIQEALTELAAHARSLAAANDNNEGSNPGVSKPEPVVPFTESERKRLKIQNEFERFRDMVNAGIGALSATGASTGLLSVLNMLVEGEAANGWSALFGE